VRMMFHLNDLMIKKTCGMTKWNKREKSTSINNKHTDDDRHTTQKKYTHTGAHSVEHIEEKKRIHLFKSIFGEQLMDLIHHILVLKSTFVEMLIMKPKLIHQSIRSIFVQVVQ